MRTKLPVEFNEPERFKNKNDRFSDFLFAKLKFLAKAILKKRTILILFSAFLLYIILIDVEFDEIINSMKNADIWLLILAFSFHSIGLTISAYRWRLLLKSVKINSSLFQLIKSYLVAIFFNHFIPSTIGGDGVRAYDSYKMSSSKSKGLSVVMVDRFLGLLALLGFVLISTFFSIEITHKIPNLEIILFFVTLAAGIIIYLMLYPPTKLFEKLNNSKIKTIQRAGDIFLKLGKSFTQLGSKKKTLFYALSLSFLLQANVILYYYIISKALGFDIHIINFSLIIPLTIFISMFPLSVNGIGIRENALFFFFSFFGVAKSQAIAFAWIEFGMLLLLGIVGGIVYAFRKYDKQSVTKNNGLLNTNEV
jgi:glycosyltransferase 2 family protein